MDASPARTERAEASSFHAGDESRSSDDERNTAEVRKIDPGSSGRENNKGSDVQGQESAPIVTVIPFQQASEAIDETEVRVDGEVLNTEEVDVGGEIQSLEKSAAVSSGSSTSPLISYATTDSTATISDSSHTPSTPNQASTSLLGLPEQQLNTSASQPKNDSQAAQAVKQSPHVVVDDSGSEATTLAEHSPSPGESQPGSALINSESVARRAFQAYLGAVSSNVRSEPSKPDLETHEGVTADHSASIQTNWYGRSLGNPENIEARERWVFPHGPQPSFEVGEHYNELWTDHNGQQPDHAVTKLPQGAVVELQAANGQSPGSVVAGVHSQSVPGPTTQSSTASFVTPPQPVVPAPDTTEQPMRVMTRSVAFNVAQPDLGHVNIRVAMTNDMVHTHLSADRPEVGQFLINGQDRLQAAFQANGLDMGQFRVDIDRQSAGRSFHHDSSQEQGQAWNQDSHGMKWEQGSDGQDEQRLSLHGLLNLVA